MWKCGSEKLRLKGSRGKFALEIAIIISIQYFRINAAKQVKPIHMSKKPIITFTLVARMIN